MQLLRKTLRDGLTRGEYGTAEQASAVCSLLELLPEGTPPGERGATVQAIAIWLSKEPIAWRAVPMALRERYHELSWEETDF